MPSSSTQAVYNGSENDTKPHTTDAASSHSGAIDRFLADQDQYHPAFGKFQSLAEAEPAAEARMTAHLRALEQQLGSSSSDKPPSS
ncbi:hypothetical protein V8C35DRAFT_329362 [Trichoderma chlorosporum]